MDDEKAQLILADIEAKIFDKVNLGFDPEVLDVLDNPDVSDREIELLKAKIGASYGTVVHTIGAVIEDTFKAVGLGGYIEIIRQPLPNRSWPAEE